MRCLLMTMQHTFNPRGLPVLLGGVLLALLALACGPAEEPTATPEPTATSAPEPTATQPAEQPEEATATPAEVPGATATPAGAAVASGRPRITPELIDRVPRMSLEETLEAFPAAYEADYTLDDIKPGFAFTAAITWDISTWDVRKAAAGGTTSVANVVYERLVQYDQSTDRNPASPAIVPDLARSWEYNEDGTKLTLQLNEGMHWGDLDDPFQPGPEIVAEDFVFIITEYRDNSIQAGNYRTVESVEAPDKYTVVMHFDAPSFFVLPFLAGKDGLQFNPHLARADRMKTELVGPGPFVLTEAKKSQEVRLERNPNHFMKDASGNQLPYLDSVRFLITPEDATRRALIRSGKVETAVSLIQRPDDLQSLLKTNPDLQVFASPVGVGSSAWTFSFQLTNPRWQDVNARRAISLALDIRGVSDLLYGRTGFPADKYPWPYYTDEMPTWESDLDALFGPYNHHYDLERAKELWAATGLGEITVEHPYYAYNASLTDRAAVFVDDLRKLGITLKPQSQDYSDYNSSLQRADYSDTIGAWQQQAYDPVGVAMVRLHSEGPGNRENINNPEIDKLVDQLMLTGDPQAQRELVNKIRAIYNEQVYFVPNPANAVSFRNISQPYVRGMHAGEYAYMSYYYQGPILRNIWLDK